jgi:hypothetical protein
VLVYDPRNVGASNVDLTRTSLPLVEALRGMATHASRGIRGEARHRLLISAATALTVGVLITPASAQSSAPPSAAQSSNDVVERSASPPDPVRAADGALSPARPTGATRMAPWGRWPRIPDSEIPEGWPRRGDSPYGADGRMCWPHGDHVHCR